MGSLTLPEALRRLSELPPGCVQMNQERRADIRLERLWTPVFLPASKAGEMQIERLLREAIEARGWYWEVSGTAHGIRASSRAKASSFKMFPPVQRGFRRGEGQYSWPWIVTITYPTAVGAAPEKPWTVMPMPVPAGTSNPCSMATETVSLAFAVAGPALPVTRITATGEVAATKPPVLYRRRTTPYPEVAVEM